MTVLGIYYLILVSKPQYLGTNIIITSAHTTIQYLFVKKKVMVAKEVRYLVDCLSQLILHNSKRNNYDGIL